MLSVRDFTHLTVYRHLSTTMTTQISIKTELTSEKISYSDIAVQLLEDKLLLTALELYFELLEAGKDLPKLREFFSNPGNFEQQSVSRLEQLASIRKYLACLPVTLTYIQVVCF